MEMISLMRAIVPGDLFDFPEEGTSVERAQHLIDQCFPGATRMRLRELSKDQAQAEIPFDMQNRALHGLMHGGCYFTVGDTLTAIMCMYQVQKPTERMLTVNASIRYLRPVDRDTVQARARLAHSQDNRFDFVVDFFNENNKRAAQAKFTYVVAELG
ncbi:MAG: PaaI family thioesterase [Leptospiraceae bacterium]|nr:PaaI family thioesterase [Leptospiraceae bacterium]MCB1320448.1 PaaI family thioesterase [Leptospiraceae bacterium]